MGRLLASNTMLFFDAVQKYEWEKVKLMLTMPEKFSLNFVHPELNLTPLMLSILRKDSLMIEILLEDQRMKIDTENSEGMTALMYAIQIGDTNMVSKLISRGASVEKRHQQYLHNIGHVAVLAGFTDVIDTLKCSNIDWNLGDWCGDTPLHVAVLISRPDIVINLLEIKNIDLFKKNLDGLTPIELSMLRGDWSAVEAFNAHIIKETNNRKKKV